jgi:two-component system, OmpR family, phosphate regulon sensor histidine kinase PhoR
MEANKHIMLQKRLIWQIFPANLATILVAIVAVTWYASSSLYTFFVNESGNDLTARAYLIKTRVERLLIESDVQELMSFCVRVGRESVTRITVIDSAGKVLADSDESPENMENHQIRPEIARAFSGARGQSLRFSRTLNESMLYVAVPLHGGNTKGPAPDASPVTHVLRMAVPVTAIEHTLQGIQLRIALGSIVVIMIAAVVTLLISRNISRPLEEMRKNAEAFAGGNFSEKMLPRQRKSVSLEVMTLATSMDRMAELLDEKIKAIETQRNQLDTVFSSMVESVIAIDLEERILSMNTAAARLLGVDHQKAQGKYVQSAIRNPDLQNQISRVLSTREPVEEEIVLQDLEGKKLLQTRIVTLFDGKSRSVGALVVMNDVTKLRRLETIRRDFVANVSHELRTPITSIRGYVETLLDGALDNRDDSIRFLQIVLRQSERLNAIIDDLLVLSRIEQESREKEIVLQDGDLYQVLTAAVQTCHLEADKVGVHFVLDCPENLFAAMNATLLEQAVVNLLVNAIKYSRQGDTVTLKAGAVGGPEARKVVISVKDTGCGIGKEHLPRLFERFYRSDRARSRADGGTGLGLAIVKHIVQAHGGKIDVQSREGVGSEFLISLTGELKG